MYSLKHAHSRGTGQQLVWGDFLICQGLPIVILAGIEDEAPIFNTSILQQDTHRVRGGLNLPLVNIFLTSGIRQYVINGPSVTRGDRA